MWKLCKWCGVKLPKGARGNNFCCNDHYQQYRRKKADDREDALADEVKRAKPMDETQAKINAYLTGNSMQNIDELIEQVFKRKVE